MVNNLHKKYRPLFQIPENWIYFDGNSLGPLQKTILKKVSNMISNEWGEQIIKGWNKSNWMTQPDNVGNLIAKLIGADKNSVTVGDTLAIKLFQAISGALQVSKKTGFVLSDESNFPSDLYIANSYLKEKNLSEVKLVNKTKIEEEFKKKSTAILIEDMATDGGSKLHFINSLRKNSLTVKDIYVVFFYNIYPSAKKNLQKMRVNLNYLASWHDILEVSPNYISNIEQLKLEQYISSIENGK